MRACLSTNKHSFLCCRKHCYSTCLHPMEFFLHICHYICLHTRLEAGAHFYFKRMTFQGSEQRQHWPSFSDSRVHKTYLWKTQENLGNQHKKGDSVSIPPADVLQGNNTALCRLTLLWDCAQDHIKLHSKFDHSERVPFVCQTVKDHNLSPHILSDLYI